MCTNFPGIRMNRDRGDGFIYGLSKIFSGQHFICVIEFFVILFFYNQVKFFKQFLRLPRILCSKYPWLSREGDGWSPLHLLQGRKVRAPHESECLLTAGRGDPTDSATENNPPV